MPAAYDPIAPCMNVLEWLEQQRWRNEPGVAPLPRLLQAFPNMRQEDVLRALWDDGFIEWKSPAWMAVLEMQAQHGTSKAPGSGWMTVRDVPWSKLGRDLQTYREPSCPEPSAVTGCEMTDTETAAALVWGLVPKIRISEAGRNAVARHRLGQDENRPAIGDDSHLSGEAKALALLVQHPDWNDKQIAEAVGCNRTTLYDWPRYKAARATQKKGKEAMPRGSKDGETADIEAWDKGKE